MGFRSPSVDVTERDFSNYVEAAGSLAVGILGVARRGDTRPTLITSQEQLIEVYGTPRPDDYGLHAAYQILAQSNVVYFGRVVPQGVKAKTGEVGTDKFTFEAKSGGSDLNGYKVVTTEPAEVALDPAQPDVKAPRFSIVLQNSKGSEIEKFENLSETPKDADYVLKVVNEQSLFIKALDNQSGAVTSKTLVFAGGVDGATYSVAGTDDTEFKFRSKSYDSTLNNCKVNVSEEDKFGYFDITITDPEGNVVEVFKSITRNPKDDSFVERYVNTYAKRVILSMNESGTKEKTYIFSGGSDKSELVTDEDYLGSRTETSGIQMFYNPETVEINTMAIPGVTSKKVLLAATKVCEGRGDCLLVMDSPFGLTPQRVNDFANATGIYTGRVGTPQGTAFNSSYSALYYPWIKMTDPFTRKDLWLPPSGRVIAQMAYSDRVGKPWFAPAGLNRGVLADVIDIEYYTDKSERDVIYGNRNVVNPLVHFIGDGIVIWGQKTTQRKTTALDRINVRRLMNYLKKVIKRSTMYFVFEDNTTYTHHRWIDTVEPKLQAIKGERGIYEMKVEMNPTDDEIRNNMMPGRIWIKPVKTAEYIPLDFMIMPDGVNFMDEAELENYK